jgi:Domain of unknown function (DUF4123)
MPDANIVGATDIKRDPAARERAKQILWQRYSLPTTEQHPNLYAILDAARNKQIYPVLRRLAQTDQVLGLYQGRAATELAAVAPYLVNLGTTDRVFDWLWEQGWGESWGIFLWSLVSPDTLRAHFRRLTMVQDDKGARLLFRFYDPRVLGAFLPTCDAAQLHEMFGPVQRLMLEQDAGRALVSFRVVEHGVNGQVASLPSAGAATAVRGDMRSTISGGAASKRPLRLVENAWRLDRTDGDQQSRHDAGVQAASGATRQC